jgi:hypothetical protein
MEKGIQMGLIGQGVELLGLIDKGANADLYAKLGSWIDTVQTLQAENEELQTKVRELTKQLEFKGRFVRVNGHTYVDGDDEEICAHCAQAEYRPFYLTKKLVGAHGLWAVCPHCGAQFGREPVRRKQAGPE